MIISFLHDSARNRWGLSVIGCSLFFLAEAVIDLVYICIKNPPVPGFPPPTLLEIASVGLYVPAIMMTVGSIFSIIIVFGCARAIRAGYYNPTTNGGRAAFAYLGFAAYWTFLGVIGVEILVHGWK